MPDPRIQQEAQLLMVLFPKSTIDHLKSVILSDVHYENQLRRYMSIPQALL